MKLKALRDKTRLSTQDVADALSVLRGNKVPKSSYTHYESRKFKQANIPVPLAQDLVKIFKPHGVAETEVMALAGIPDASVNNHAPPQPPAIEPLTFPGATRDLEQYIRPVAPMRAGARDVPIYGYAKGGKDAYFIDQGAKLGMAYRPNALDSVPDAFAIEIWDHSMHPALKHGHQALVHPNKRPMPGEEVLVTLIDGQAMVKELVRDTERVLVLRQHNPPEEIKIDRKRVAKVQLIVDSPRVRI